MKLDSFAKYSILFLNRRFEFTLFFIFKPMLDYILISQNLIVFALKRLFMASSKFSWFSIYVFKFTAKFFSTFDVERCGRCHVYGGSDFSTGIVRQCNRNLHHRRRHWRWNDSRFCSIQHFSGSGLLRNWCWDGQYYTNQTKISIKCERYSIQIIFPIFLINYNASKFFE